MKLDVGDLTFLARFARSPDGQVMLRILRAELAACDAELRLATGEHLVRWQGKSQQVDALIESILGAEKKLTRSPPSRPRVVDSAWDAS